jgi:Carboxypeptidase regulatory-like domain
MRIRPCCLVFGGILALAACEQHRTTLSSFMVPSAVTHDLSGTVSSADGGPVDSATVTFTTSRRPTGVTEANDGGFYRIPGLEPGTVVVTMSATGYAAETQTVNVTTDLVLDVTLRPLPSASSVAAVP